MKRFVTYIALIIAALNLSATDTMTGIFSPRFQTLRVEVEGMPLAPPIIHLGVGDQVKISFDEMTDDRSYLRYSLTHCDADWRPSRVVESEYLDGFNQADVDTYDYSRGTTAHYVNYSITIPNEQINPRLSGNYLLRVWDEADPDTTLLQARFMVAESGAGVSVDLTTRTDIDYNDRHQQMSLTIDAPRGSVADPFNDLIVKVAQNGRVDNEVTLRRPSRVLGSKVIYDHQPALIFPAGNEYRRFETVSVTYPGMGVDYIEHHDPYYHFTLAVDEPRAESQYLYDRTQHGRFVIREYNSSASDIEADYGVVHFSLAMPELRGYDIFLDGDMVHRRFDPESRMVYNQATGRYERAMLLKQGAYNYQYLAVPAGSMRGETAPVEGDFYPTVNEYVITVYDRRPGARYDRLIGASVIKSDR